MENNFLDVTHLQWILQTKFGLPADEFEKLERNLRLNLKFLRQTLLESYKIRDWDSLREAADALDTVAENLMVGELGQLAGELGKAAHQQDSEATESALGVLSMMLKPLLPEEHTPPGLDDSDF
jgi:hypothetical protein